MTCWNGHLPHMTDAQLRQATEAYAQASAAFHHSFQARMQSQWWAPTGAIHEEPPVATKPRRTTSLAPARAGDKLGAIDVEYVRVR